MHLILVGHFNASFHGLTDFHRVGESIPRPKTLTHTKRFLARTTTSHCCGRAGPDGDEHMDGHKLRKGTVNKVLLHVHGAAATVSRPLRQRLASDQRSSNRAPRRFWISIFSMQIPFLKGVGRLERKNTHWRQYAERCFGVLHPPGPQSRGSPGRAASGLSPRMEES